MNNKNEKVFPVEGIRLSSIYSGMYKKKRLDLSIMEIDIKSNVAAVFTKNKAKSPTIIFSKKNLKQKNPKYIIVNSGNANAGTGVAGYNDLIKYSNEICKRTSSCIEDILVFSTGVIGERIKVKNIINSIPTLLKNFHKNSWYEFSNAILTTDKVNKICSKSIKIKDKNITITGVVKGSGMIMPNMATMLSFVATDLKISKKILSSLLREITDVSYNMITVDGETSTNDASVLIATGKSNINYNSLENKLKTLIKERLKEIYQTLAKKIVEDGEGATKFITVNVKNANSIKNAKNIAMSIANSPLVKTALFAEDPNWGRILSAIGNSKTSDKNLPNLEIKLGKMLVFKNNKLYSKYKEYMTKEYLKNKSIEINVSYNTGVYNATVWTSDLTYEYIKINANYRS